MSARPSALAAAIRLSIKDDVVSARSLSKSRKSADPEFARKPSASTLGQQRRASSAIMNRNGGDYVSVAGLRFGWGGPIDLVGKCSRSKHEQGGQEQGYYRARRLR
jgi:hypothetical protein